MPSVAYLVARHPMMGGEYYRATRPAALANSRFGWETHVCTHMATLRGADDGPLCFVTQGGNVCVPNIIVLRPVREWRLKWSEQAKANGQVIIADLDDDLWSHENYAELQETAPDHYNEWFWSADGVLVSTRALQRRIVGMGHPGIVAVAPNCYDPFGLATVPREPGHAIGTRLWIDGRMSGDLDLYDELFYPLLNPLDLTFIHVGAKPNARFAWDTPRLIERPSTVIPTLPQALVGLNIGAIAMSDHAYNDAKTETHAIELASMGVPLVAASNHPLYKNVPGRVDPTPGAVLERLFDLLEPSIWQREADRAVRWARDVSVRAESSHLSSLLRVVNLLYSR